METTTVSDSSHPKNPQWQNRYSNNWNDLTGWEDATQVGPKLLDRRR
jgi:hypothetical protein